MDASIRQILDPRILTASYQQMPVMVPTPLTDALFVNPEQVEDDSFRTLYDPADSTPAPGNQVGSEARVIALGNAKEKIFNMIFSFNKTMFGESVFRALREPDSYTLQNMGRTEVNRVARKFANRQRQFKEVVLSKILTTGKLYMDPAGRILENSTGAAVSADFEVASSHQGDLGGLISGLFSVPGTDIPAIIEDIDDAAAQAHVPIPTNVWVNKLNLQHLRNNNAFKFWAQHNPGATDQVLRGGIIEGLWGKTWHFVSGYYTAADGSNKPLIPTTGQGSAVFTPPANNPWLKCSVGATVLPKSINVSADIDEALSNLSLAYGSFMYAKLLDDPVRLVGYMGDKFGFNFNEPGAIWQSEAF